MKKIVNDVYVKCVVAVMIIMAICSKSSFLYPINNWGDASCYYIVGRGILHGLVPYKDYAEQKGPIIFFLYALGELISEHSFIGIYIIECICAVAFLIVSLKILGLFYDINDYELFLAFGLSAIVYSSTLMKHGGGPEELSLCIVSYSIYLVTKYFEKNELPTKFEMFLFGICAALIFWTKYTLCALYIGVIIFMLIHSISMIEIKMFLNRTVYFILACISVSIAILGYFAINDALYDLYKWYFYNNIFLYSSNEIYDIGVLNNLVKATSMIVRKKNILCVFFLIMGIAWFIKNKKYKTLNMYLGIFVFSFIMSNAKVPQQYSSMPLMAFCVFGFLPIIYILRKTNTKLNIVITCIYIVICAFLSYVISDNTSDLLNSRKDIVQYRFAERMQRDNDGDYSMLYYGYLDPAFYFASGKIPKWKAFDQLNISGNELKDLQDGYINNKEPDFVVTTSFLLCDSADYTDVVAQNEYRIDNKNIVAFDDFGYHLIDEEQFVYDGYNVSARLYGRNE